jgi:TRAP-type uncharacterized transport system fused permease subunit
MGVTGFGIKVARHVDRCGVRRFLLALFFTMTTSIILGAGLPATAYLILATVVALVETGRAG